MSDTPCGCDCGCSVRTTYSHPLCRCGNDLTVAEAENSWACAACRWEADQDRRAEQ